MFPKMDPQAVGLITVLAISGGIAVLSLRKQKWRLVIKDKLFGMGDHDKLGSQIGSPCFTTRFSEDDINDVGMLHLSTSEAAVNGKICNGRNIGGCENEVHWHSLLSSMDVNDELLNAAESKLASVLTGRRSSSEMASGTAPLSAMATRGNKTRKERKKVQFAIDVVEPAGDNQEYRRVRRARRVASSYTSMESCYMKQQHQADHATAGSSSQESWRAERSISCATNHQKKQQETRATTTTTYACGVIASTMTTTTETETQDDLKQQQQQYTAVQVSERRRSTQPKLPANRLALYKGLCQYRSQQRAVYC